MAILDLRSRTVSKITKTLKRVLGGRADANIRFDDLRALLAHFGFSERIRGDHHICTHDGLAEILNLQPRGSKAKAYQVKQVRAVLIASGLAGDRADDSGEGGTEATDHPSEEEHDDAR